MSNASFVLMLTPMLMPLAACDDAARSVDYAPSSGISADIDASHETGAGLEQRGMTPQFEPYGALPWQLGQGHQSAH